MNEYYQVTIYFSIMLMVVMEICIFCSSTLASNKKWCFLILFSIVIFCALCEWLGNFLDGSGSSTTNLHIIVKIFELSVAPFIGIFMAEIISKAKLKPVIITLLVLHAIAEIFSGKYGFIFYIDENSVFHNGQFYWVYVAVYFIAILYAVINMIFSMREYQYSGLAFLIAFLVFMMGSLMMQFLSDDLKISWMTISVGCVLLYIFNAEMIQQTDELTKLLNRRGFDIYADYRKEKSIIIMFDIDLFKLANDNHGHSFGDKCLKSVSDCILKTYAKYGKCFRIGGDEFCVILKKNLDYIEELNREFFSLIYDERQKDTRLPMVSIGYAYYDPMNISFQKCVDEADEMMYKYKREHKDKEQQFIDKIIQDNTHPFKV